MELILADEIEKLEITETRTKQLESAFLPMFTMLNAVDEEFETVSSKPIDKETCAEARKLRLRIVKIRTATAEVHKEQKADILLAGKAIDGIHNVFKYAISGKEKTLKDIEEHFENIQKDIIDKLQASRLAELIEADFLQVPNNVGEMDELAYDIFLGGAQAAQKRKLEEEEEAKKRAEAEAERQRGIVAENARLKKIADDAQAEIDAEKQVAENARLAEKKKTDAAEAKAVEIAERLRKQAHDAEIARAALEAETEAEKQAEAQRLADIESAEAERIEQLAAAGDDEKLLDYMNQVNAIVMPELSDRARRLRLDMLIGSIELI